MTSDAIREGAQMSAQIRKCFYLVKSWRKRTQKDYPCPGPAVSLDCAAHELGEVFDAKVRENNPELLRNNQREQYFWPEVCDTAYMILTSVLQREDAVREIVILPASPKIMPMRALLLHCLGMAMVTFYADTSDAWLRHCFLALAAIAMEENEKQNLFDGIAQRLERIEAKNGFAYDESFDDFLCRIEKENEAQEQNTRSGIFEAASHIFSTQEPSSTLH